MRYGQGFTHVKDPRAPSAVHNMSVQVYFEFLAHTVYYSLSLLWSILINWTRPTDGTPCLPDIV